MPVLVLPRRKHTLQQTRNSSNGSNSNNNSTSSTSIRDCGRSLSLLVKEIELEEAKALRQVHRHQGTIIQDLTMDIAKSLSPTAREEINAAYQTFLVEHDDVHHKKTTSTKSKKIDNDKTEMLLQDDSSSTSSKKADVIPEPPRRELYSVALNQMIPFIGFGIMDNAILILAGDAIDYYLGVALGISTLCAAAIGNIISDVAGVMLGTAIEDVCQNLGLPVPNLTAAQRQLRSVRFASQMGCAVGLVIGCIIGMVPLLFIDHSSSSCEEKEEEEKKQQQQDEREVTVSNAGLQ